MKPFTPPLAVVTRLLLALCVAVQVAATLGGHGFAVWMIDNFGLVPARLTHSVGIGAAKVLPGSCRHR